MLPRLSAINRVVLGLEPDSNVAAAIQTAVRLASVHRSDLSCVIVQQEELLDAARLPFASAVGRGGRVVPFTSGLIEAHFKSVCGEAERSLAAACGNREIRWQLQRLHGKFLRELMSGLTLGDTVVLGRPRDFAGSRVAIRSIRDILHVASAVVVPARQPRTSGWVHAIGGSRATQIADDLAHAFGLPRDETGRDIVMRSRRPAAVVVTSLEVMEAEGDGGVLGALEAMDTTIVVVAEEIAESKRQLR